MRHHHTLCFFLTITALLWTAGSTLAWAQGGAPLKIEEVATGAFYPRTAGSDFRSLPNGKSYTILSADQKSIEQYSYATGKKEATLLDLRTAKGADQIKQIEEYTISPTGHHILIHTEVANIYRRSKQAIVYSYDVRRNLISPLSAQEGAISIPTFSPDGRMVAFVRARNIFVKKFDYDSEVQITTDGADNEILNGSTDWVYEEEFATTQLMTWSQDSRFLAFVKSNESQVLSYAMPIYSAGLYPQDWVYKYPKAGETNSTVSVWVHDLDLKTSKEVPLNQQDSQIEYIPRVEFTPFDNQLAIATLNRRQDRFVLYLTNPQSLVAKPTLEITDKQYVNSDFIQSMQIDSQGFLLIHEEGGFAQAYSYGPTGQSKRLITTGRYDVLSLYGRDERGNVYLQAADESPIGRRILKIDRKGNVIPLSEGRGVHNAEFSKDFSYLVCSSSMEGVPPVITLKESATAKTVRVLEDNKALRSQLAQYAIPKKEFITLEVAPGRTLHGWILRPTHFSPSKKYPVVMTQYSGPDSQEVLDRYEVDWVHVLAQQGFVVACFDGRGTGARGSDWRKCTYLNLGDLESADQIAAAEALKKKYSYLDPNRFAIWGWSFGGYNVLKVLERNQNHTFAAGVAIAPVTDWRFYDTVYTERFMRTPQENPQGYQASSCLIQAQNLTGKLLMISGSADDNVHLQNTMFMSDALIYSDVPFEMAVYPDRNHGIYGGNARPHLYKKVIEFLHRSLQQQ